MMKKLLLLVFVFPSIFTAIYAQSKKSADKTQLESAVPEKKKESKIKDYSQVITKDAVSSASRALYKVRNLDKTRSLITSVKSFPLNIEVV